MRKKVTLGIMTVGLMFTLTGCCISHDWKEATCTEPKTCAKCGETAGEALGHVWNEATCVDAKTCSICGETEGEALGHTLTTANYQQAATCTVCGDTVGEPVQSYFEEHELTEYLVELGKEYDYVTMCNENNSYTTVGKAVFSNYRTYTSDSIHPEKEGYEWKSVDISIIYSDANARAYGMDVTVYTDDYYDDVRWYDEGAINYYGVDYTDCIHTSDNTAGFSGWKNNENTYSGTFSVQVPIGYDGLLLTLMNEQIDDWTYIGELKGTDPLFFRFE